MRATGSSEDWVVDGAVEAGRVVGRACPGARVKAPVTSRIRAMVAMRVTNELQVYDNRLRPGERRTSSLWERCLPLLPQLLDGLARDLLPQLVAVLASGNRDIEFRHNA